jgi:hypothetical protein
MNDAQPRRLTQRERKVLAILLVGVSAICLVGGIVSLISLAPSSLSNWLAAHGRYPTGHLTYSVPGQWDTVTLTGLTYQDPNVWWSVFTDRVTLTSSTESECYTDAQCAKASWTGARVNLESAAGAGLATIKAWYQDWAAATTRHYASSLLVLPLSDYWPATMGGQPAICATNQEGSQFLSPHVPPSPDFDTTFLGYTGPAVVMCFTLWQGRTYCIQAAFVPHTTTQDRDVVDTNTLIGSLHFT